MNYFVKHGDEQWGPYSLADLQNQFQAGKISAGDFARSEGMNDWAPVVQVVGNIPVPVSAGYGTAVAPAMESIAAVDLPPNLHWSIILLINIASRFVPFVFLFNMVWTLVLANWARKLDGNVNTMVLVAMYPAGFIAGIFAWTMNPETAPTIGGVLIFGGIVAYIIGVFKIKAAMEAYYNSTEDINLRLSGGMTFFFSTVYLQFHLNKIHKWKKTGEHP